MSVKIARESLTVEVFDELLPLARKSWHENTKAKADTCAYYGERDFDIEPDLDTYLRLADQGDLVLVTVRDESAIKGYVIGILYHSLHHKRILCALGDSIYVEPSHRTYTGPLAEKFEQELKALDVEIIGWPVHINGPVYSVLKARGYAGDETVMEKRLEHGT